MCQLVETIFGSQDINFIGFDAEIIQRHKIILFNASRNSVSFLHSLVTNLFVNWDTAEGLQSTRSQVNSVLKQT